jgi:hypothetical protein
LHVFLVIACNKSCFPKEKRTIEKQRKIRYGGTQTIERRIDGDLGGGILPFDEGSHQKNFG